MLKGRQCQLWADGTAGGSKAGQTVYAAGLDFMI